MSSQVDRLKAEGNALFAKKKFSAAYKKYSEALEHDGNNPVLYSNRAACCLNMNRYALVST
jgi:Flp pilus assembly protein TadD